MDRYSFECSKQNGATTLKIQCDLFMRCLHPVDTLPILSSSSNILLFYEIMIGMLFTLKSSGIEIFMDITQPVQDLREDMYLETRRND